MSVDAAFLDALEAAARDAGRAIISVRKAGFETERKSDASPVTEADRAAEAVIMEHLHRIAPGVPVVAEEAFAAGQIPETDGEFFLVDPLDGTREFVAGRDEFTVNIGLIVKGVPTAGLLYAPAKDLMYAASPQAAWFIDGTHRRILAGRQPDMAQLVAVASRSHRDQATNELLEALKVSDTVGVGSSLKFTLLAEGRADLYPRYGRTMEWDTAAGDAILRASGGQVLDIHGNPVRYGKADIDDPFAHAGFIAFASEKAAHAYLSHINLR
ncbi:3'(2'),5'-bisphosphate nucleotidase CysQ [Hyphobacterium indicum]|uniref:3'(2'),5'-bisphosphate nucleotidase CysQ n=1 Tax=Hyphobacterium indicum TaxID=2162714 RepID=UPI001F314F0B|nr:3'(2'),5'-bisphosphate nucleotidase CysQ [Hyphobacterium indicum]